MPTQGELPEVNLFCVRMQSRACCWKRGFLGRKNPQHFQVFAAQDYNIVSPSPAALNSGLTPHICMGFAGDLQIRDEK